MARYGIKHLTATRVINGENMPNRTAYTEGNDNSSSVIEGENGKKYCPNDRRLLVYRDDIRKLFCADCGYSPENSLETIEESASFNNRNHAADKDIWVIPATQPRSEQTRQRVRLQSHQCWDRDMQRMQDAGYTIKDSKEIFHGASTYSYSNNATDIRKRYY